MKAKELRQFLDKLSTPKRNTWFRDIIQHIYSSIQNQKININDARPKVEKYVNTIVATKYIGAIKDLNNIVSITPIANKINGSTINKSLSAAFLES